MGQRAWRGRTVNHSDQLDDAYLVRRAQEGFVDAFEELVRRHSVRVYRTALRMVGNDSDAQDLAQDTFLAAWRALPEFRGQSAFSTWLYRIVTRLALNRLQRQRSTVSLDNPASGRAAAEPVDDTGGPATQAEQRETADAVTRAITALPPAQRVVVVLHHFERLPYAEIADVTKSTVPAVRSHLYRARRTLAQTLQEWR